MATKKAPKDLGVKVLTKKQAYWNELKLACEGEIKHLLQTVTDCKKALKYQRWNLENIKRG